MYIESVKIKGFQCYGDAPVNIYLQSDVTTLIGANGTGKTALLQGFLRLFGVTQNQRTIKTSDFFVPPGETCHSKEERFLWLDVRLAFPELTAGSDDSQAVPPCFKHMIVESPGAEPFCRMRLEAKWTNDGTVEGDIEQTIYWIATDIDEPKEEHKKPVSAHERGLIQVHYLPASRDEAALIKYSTKLMTGRLLKAIEWSAGTVKVFEEASRKIQSSFGAEKPVKAINAVLKKEWSFLNDFPLYTNPELQIVSSNFEKIIKNVNILFNPDSEGNEAGLDDLSDGQKSLFYFSLAISAFSIERKIVESASSKATKKEISGFNRESLNIPSLTIFALEEPENHLAPYYLSRIIRQVRGITQSGAAQAVFTSHSPAMLTRVDPKEICHFRLSSDTGTAQISPITIPDKPEDAAKYIREAVIAFPEIYFAKFVILCEGDSEQIVLPRIAAALNLEIDPSFVAIVPLGGRHVNHFWKLLADLQIPFATLLDFDLGRDGAGWGRIKYVCDQLIEIGFSKKKLLTSYDDDGNESVLSDKDYDEMSDWKVDLDDMKDWLNFLKKYGVFFSYPLDLDMSMLVCFQSEYKKIGKKGPSTDIKEAAQAVLKKSGPGLSAYSGKLEKLHEFFPWYNYLFLGKSKPATHLLALSEIDDSKLKKSAPSRIISLLQYVDKKINPTE